MLLMMGKLFNFLIAPYCKFLKIETSINFFRFGLRDSKRFNIVPSVLRSSKGKGSKSAKRKGHDSNEGDKENVPLASYGVTVTDLTNQQSQPVNQEVKVNYQFLPPVTNVQPIRDRNGVPVKVYSKYT